MKINLSILLQCVALLLGSAGCTLKADSEIQQQAKINGLSYAAANVLLDSTDVVSMREIGANWVALMPYGFIRGGENKVIFNSERQWVSETSEGIRIDIEVAQKAGLKIMLKPHIWIGHGIYTGDFELKEEEEWKKLEQSYHNYLLTFAKIAEIHQIELFCIGTEWRKFIAQRPSFWHALIKDIRAVYNGKLIYAANWDEYHETPFWNDLDFIGVNGYFPLTESENPSIQQVELAWQPIIKQLMELSNRHQKQIIFTEYGYRSIIGTTITPWVSDTKVATSMEEQKVALAALYNSVWQEPWFAGGFLWKWFNANWLRGGELHTGFTPQNKPAALVVHKQYSRSID